MLWLMKNPASDNKNIILVTFQWKPKQAVNCYFLSMSIEIEIKSAMNLGNELNTFSSETILKRVGYP